MSCYRSGGCGPYEYLSCSECPASKPEYLVKDKPKKPTNSGLQELFSTEYVQGYRAALMDIQRIVSQDLKDDLKRHKKKMNPKTLSEIIDVLLQERAILRENPDAFVRCTKDGGFEVYIAHKDEHGRHV